MEKKKTAEKSVHLRLVKMPENESTQTKEQPEFRSAFAKSVNSFADDLDLMIEAILRS